MNNTVQPNFTAIPKQYSIVDKYLIRGPVPSIKDLIQLKKEGINQIYDFRNKDNFKPRIIEKFICKILGITYINHSYSLYNKLEFPSLDTFEQIAQSVNQNGKKGGITLFHCSIGKHRTGEMSAFYALTNGEKLSKIKEKLGAYYENFKNRIIDEQIIEYDYFDREINTQKTYNPIKSHYIKHNNKVRKATEDAYKIFLDMLE